MSALPLFDSVLLSAAGNASANRSATDRLTHFAHQLVQSSLGDLADIEAFDKALARPDAEDFDPQSAILLRGMYEQWTRDVDAVLERVAKVERMGIPVPSAQPLRDAQGRLLAMLQVSLDDIQQGRRQFRQRRTWTREEIRAGLGISLQ